MLLLENIVYLIKVIVTVRSIYQARLKCAQRRSNPDEQIPQGVNAFSRMQQIAVSHAK